jgi:hypothetical protein
MADEGPVLRASAAVLRLYAEARQAAIRECEQVARELIGQHQVHPSCGLTIADRIAALREE